MEYEVIEYHPDLRDDVVQLATRATNSDAVLSSEYLRWKYERNPYVDTPRIYLATHRGRVVAMRGAYGSKWQIGESRTTFIVPCFGDLVIAEEHRNRGLFSLIMSFALRDLHERGYSHAFSLSPGQIAILGSMATGWQAIGSPEPMARRRRAGRLKGYVRRTAWLASTYRRIHPLVSRFTHPPTRSGAAAPKLGETGAFEVLDSNGARTSQHGPVVVTDYPRPREMAQLFGRLELDGRLRHERSEEYFAWRFQDPRFRYRFLFWEDGGLEGYLTLGALRRRWSRGARIIDWEGSDPTLNRELLDAAVEWGKFQKVSLWSANLPHPMIAVLRATGFEKEEPGSWISTALVRPTSAVVGKDDWVLEGRNLRDIANWDLRMIYSDAF